MCAIFFLRYGRMKDIFNVYALLHKKVLVEFLDESVQKNQSDMLSVVVLGGKLFVFMGLLKIISHKLEHINVNYLW